MELPLVLVNLKDGFDNGLVLHLLSTIMAPCQTTRPAIIANNKARWPLPRRRPEREAAADLSRLYDGRYKISIGEIEGLNNPSALL